MDRMSEFLIKYQLTEDEVNVLKYSDIEVSHAKYFSAFARLDAIKQDCQVLLTTQEEVTNGVELLESVSKQQEDAYKRLYEWALGKCNDLEHTDRMSLPFSKAMLVLRNRPAFYS